MAKGAHRRTKAGSSKFDGGVDLLDVGEAGFIHAPERDLGILTEWHLTEGHLALRTSLRALYLSQYAGELVSVLLEVNDAHVALFDRLTTGIPALGTARIEEEFLALELDILREAGYLPEFGRCVVCGRPALTEKVYFSPREGGIVCRNCEAAAQDRVEIDPRLVRLADTVAKLPRVDHIAQRLPRLTRHQTDPLNRLLARYVELTLGKRLAVARYVLR